MWNRIVGIVRHCGLAVAVLGICRGALAAPLTPAPKGAALAQARAAALAEDWRRVADLLGDPQELEASPVARFLKAHACLALNRNNESLSLLLSATSGEDLKAWEEWTRAQTGAQPRSVIARYLRGDALARLGKWDDSLAELQQALALSPEHHLALNARGVVRATKGELNEAMMDFDAAAKARPGLAVAHAHLGAVAMHMQEGAKGALKDFEKALAISPDFALAIYGRGCLMAILGQWGKAEGDFRDAVAKAGPAAPALRAAVLKGLDAAAPRRTALAEADPKKAQAALQAECQKIRSGDWGFRGSQLKNLERSYANDPAALSQINSAIQDCVRQKPEFAPYADKYARQTINEFDAARSRVRVERDTGITGGVSGITAGPGGVVGGEINGNFNQRSTYDYTSQHQTLTDNIKNVRDTFLRANDPAGNPNGFDSGLGEALWDDGDWPFIPQYCLAYGVPTAKASGNGAAEPSSRVAQKGEAK